MSFFSSFQGHLKIIYFSSFPLLKFENVNFLFVQTKEEVSHDNSPLFTEGEEQSICQKRLQEFIDLQDIIQYLQGTRHLRRRC